MTDWNEVTPFAIAVPESELRDLRERLRRARWPEAETVEDWSQGVPLAYLNELCGYWAEDYDWRATERRLNAVPQFRTEIDGLGIYYLHVRSSHEGALPPVLTHGWPGSVVEFLKVIGPLTDPAAHGGEARDAFHVVCPSLPGYGFSDKPERTGWGIERIAGAWEQLMARLGYERYGAQGGDWGTSISAALAQRDPDHVAGIHLTPPLAPPDPATFHALTERERAALASLEHAAEWESGYSRVHATRPQTVGYGLADSPVALCAWIVERFQAWTDCDGHPENALTRNELLDNLMLYWLPRTGASSARLYWESIRQVDEWISGSVTETIDVPTGCSIFARRSSARHAAGRSGASRTSATGTSSTGAATSRPSSNRICSYARFATCSGSFADSRAPRARSHTGPRRRDVGSTTMTTLGQHTTFADPVAVPQMNGQERLTFTIYAVLCAVLLIFLLASSAFWLI